MNRVIVMGGKRLAGEVVIGGSKNAALPLLFAGILTRERCVFYLTFKKEKNKQIKIGFTSFVIADFLLVNKLFCSFKCYNCRIICPI